MLIITLANLKGGSTKTTSAAFIAHALHESGLRVLAVDADGENESLVSWSEAADWPFPVIGMPVRNLHHQLPGVAGDRYDAVVIDTPPLHEQRGIVMSASRLSTHIICPMAPSKMEYKRLTAMTDLLEDVKDLRDTPPVFAVLLTRTVASAASPEVFRQLITEDGVHVLKPHVARLERFAQAYGDPVVDAANTAYGDALEELLSLDAEPAAVPA